MSIPFRAALQFLSGAKSSVGFGLLQCVYIQLLTLAATCFTILHKQLKHSRIYLFITLFIYLYGKCFTRTQEYSTHTTTLNQSSSSEIQGQPQFADRPSYI